MEGGGHFEQSFLQSVDDLKLSAAWKNVFCSFKTKYNNNENYVCNRNAGHSFPFAGKTPAISKFL
jgi:hypothetical protein